MLVATLCTGFMEKKRRWRLVEDWCYVFYFGAGIIGVEEACRGSTRQDGCGSVRHGGAYWFRKLLRLLSVVAVIIIMRTTDNVCVRNSLILSR